MPARGPVKKAVAKKPAPARKAAAKAPQKVEVAVQLSSADVVALSARIEELTTTVRGEAEAAAASAKQSKETADNAADSAASSASAAASAKDANGRLKLAVAAVSLVALIAIFAAVRANTAADKANDAIAAQRSETTQRRVDACKRENGTREASRLNASTTAAGFSEFAAQLLSGVTVDSELQKRLDLFNARIVQPQLHLADEKVGPFAPRDCRPEVLNKDPNS